MLWHRVAAGYLSAALVLAVGVLAFRGAHRTVAAYTEVGGMNHLLAAVHRVGDDVRDAESGQRGYLLTGRANYLAPYQHAMDESDSVAARLRAAAAPYAEYRARVDSLIYFVHLKLGEVGETVRLRQYEGATATESVLRTDRGQQTMDRIRALLSSLDGDVASDIASAEATASKEQQWIGGLIILGTLVAGGLALLLNLLHARQSAELERLNEELGRQSYELHLQAAELEAANSELEETTREMVEQTVEAEVSQLRLAGILGSATDAIISFDDEQRIVYFNTAAEQMLGVSAEKVIGTSVTRFVPQRDLLQYEDRVTLARRAGRTLGGANLWEVVACRDDGAEVPVEASMSYARSTGKLGLYTMILRDVSNQRQLEEQFRQAQKMEAVGRLAGGIAHDFNNLLTVIGASTDFLLQDLGTDASQLKSDVAEIRSATDRAAALTRQLLAFSRRQLVQPQLLDLNAVVSEMETMLRRLIGEDVALDTAYDEDLGAVRLDRGQVEQIVVNLVVNARDAMPHGGVVHVSTANAPASTHATLAAVDAGALGYVMLSVRDNGVGMDEGTRLKIFEPFFTTKELGKGTGLGLSTVYGIVKQYGGDITVQSEPGLGTEFRLYFPRVAQDPVVDVPQEQTADALRGSETILVVEDEEPLRRLARRILESRGYRVLDAGNGYEAIDVMAKHGSEVDLLLSDIVMPSMGGRELVERLLPVYPSLLVLFMSGYTEDMMLQHRIAELGITVLEKPFTPETLARTVRHALDRAGRNPRARV